MEYHRRGRKNLQNQSGRGLRSRRLYQRRRIDTDQSHRRFQKAVPFIEAYLNGDDITYREPYYVTKEHVDQDYLESIKKNKRPVMVHLTPDARNDNFLEVVEGYTRNRPWLKQAAVWNAAARTSSSASSLPMPTNTMSNPPNKGRRS